MALRQEPELWPRAFHHRREAVDEDVASLGEGVSQIVGDRRIPFDDRAVAEEILAELGGGW